MNRKTITFFVATFIASWILWMPGVLNTQWRSMPKILLFFGMFASFMPSVIGVVMMKKEHSGGFWQYLKGRILVKFPKKWFLALMIFPVQTMVALELVKVLDKSFAVVDPVAFSSIPLEFLQILLIGGALGEEFGWRGYVFEKMRDNQGFFLGTLLLGALWSLWHLPLFFMSGTVQSYIPIWQFLIQNTLLAFFYSWLYQKTKGSLLFMILLHGVLNTSSAVFPYWQSNIGRYIGLAVLVATLIIILAFERFSSGKQRVRV